MWSGPNTEVRRFLIGRQGRARYIQDCGAEVIDCVPEDHPIPGLRGARLSCKELEGEPESIVYLERVNSTSRPDGTFKRHGGEAGKLCHAVGASAQAAARPGWALLTGYRSFPGKPSDLFRRARGPMMRAAR